ncbi:MAG: hypothetical protein JNN33_10470 [Rhodospirillaceae bacterium]|jgi:hypothetical protein|nr:hypothetical protein [Rhodospirillaceae bacterium]
MKQITIVAWMLGAILVAGCTVSQEGVSLSEAQWVDNNCSGNAFFVNRAWCADGLGASMGPYTGR